MIPISLLEKQQYNIICMNEEIKAILEFLTEPKKRGRKLLKIKIHNKIELLIKILNNFTKVLYTIEHLKNNKKIMHSFFVLKNYEKLLKEKHEIVYDHLINDHIQFFNELYDILNNYISKHIIEIIEETKEKSRTPLIKNIESNNKTKEYSLYESIKNNLTNPKQQTTKNFTQYLLNKMSFYKENILFNLISIIFEDLTKTNVKHLTEKQQHFFKLFFKKYAFELTENSLLISLELDYSGGLLFLCYFAITKALPPKEQVIRLITIILLLEQNIKGNNNYNEKLKIILENRKKDLEFFMLTALPEPPQNDLFFIPKIKKEKITSEILKKHFEDSYNNIIDETFLQYVYEKKDIIKNIKINFIQIIFGCARLEHLTPKYKTLLLLFIENLLTKKAYENIENKINIDPTRGFLIFCYYYCWKHYTKERNYHKLVYVISRIISYVRLNLTDYTENSIKEILQTTVDKNIQRFVYLTLDEYKQEIFKLFRGVQFSMNQQISSEILDKPKIALHLTKFFKQPDFFDLIYTCFDIKFLKYIKLHYNQDKYNDVGNLISLLFDNYNLTEFEQLNEIQLTKYFEFMLQFLSPEILLYTIYTEPSSGGMFLFRYYICGLKNGEELNQKQLKKLLYYIKIFQQKNNIKTLYNYQYY